jgi:hypothetical protein
VKQNRRKVKYWTDVPGLSPEIPERGGPSWLLKLRLMGTQRVHMKGILSWLVRWTFMDFYPALAALGSPVQSIFFSPYTIHCVCVQIDQQPGQAVVQDRLSLSVCLRLSPTPRPRVGDRPPAPHCPRQCYNGWWERFIYTNTYNGHMWQYNWRLWTLWTGSKHLKIKIGV